MGFLRRLANASRITMLLAVKNYRYNLWMGMCDFSALGSDLKARIPNPTDR